MKIIALVCLGLFFLIAVVVVLTPLRSFNALVPKDGNVDAAAEGVRFGDDPRQMLDIYRPANAGMMLPVIVFCYGGGWDSGDRGGYEFVGRSLAAAGFLTIVHDYRLVPEVRFPAFVEDTARALAWTHANATAYGGDARRIFFVGHSAGAYNVMMAALDRRYFKAAGVPDDAVKGIVGLAGPYDFLPFDIPATRNAFSQWPEPGDTQPVSFARGDAPPMLLLTGAADTTVFPRNTMELARRQRGMGAAVDVKTYDGMGHVGIVLALSRPFRDRSAVRSDVISFLTGLSRKDR